MGRILLFTGAPRVGKSTAIREVITAVGQDRCTGFITVEERFNGQRTGFSICMIDGRSGTLASIDSASSIRVKSFSQGPGVSYGIDLSFLEKIAIPAIRDDLGKDRDRLLVIDEIGPMQLWSEMFKKFIIGIADDDDALLLGSIVQRSLPWTDELKSLPNVETFLLTTQNRETLIWMMSEYLIRKRRPRQASEARIATSQAGNEERHRRPGSAEPGRQSTRKTLRASPLTPRTVAP